MKLLIMEVLEVLSKNVNKIFGIELKLEDIQNSTKKEYKPAIRIGYRSIRRRV